MAREKEERVCDCVFYGYVKGEKWYRIGLFKSFFKKSNLTHILILETKEIHKQTLNFVVWGKIE